MSVKTTGELRALLLGTIEGVCAGTIELQKASAIAKLAGQVAASMTAEAQVALVAHKLGFTPGTMQIGPAVNDDALQSLPKPTSEIAAETNGKQWCEQCEMRVNASEAATCKSRFCSLRKSA